MIENPALHTILVTGATGQQGGAAARHLREAGFTVRALTRNPETEGARALADAGCHVVRGGFGDRASLDAALEGVYGAFSVQTFFEEGVEAEKRQGVAFADAAAEAGIQHFVYSSVGAAQHGTGIPHFESKWAIEEHIRDLGLPATIFRPVSFMENWVSYSREAIDLEAGTLTQPFEPDTKLEYIAVDDIGAFVALAFSDPERWIGREVQLAGDRISLRELADLLSDIAGREVTYVQIPWEPFEQAVGPDLAMMYRWFESDGFETDIAALRGELPSLTRLGPFLRRHLR